MNLTSLTVNATLIQNRVKNWTRHLAKYDLGGAQMKLSMQYNYKDQRKRTSAGELRNLPFIAATFGAVVGLVVTLIGESVNRGGLRDATDRGPGRRWLQRLLSNQMFGWTTIRINCDKNAEHVGKHNIGKHPVFCRS